MVSFDTCVEVISACERLSGYIEGHLHSDELAGTRPTPKLLIDEVERFDKLVKKHRALSTTSRN